MSTPRPLAFIDAAQARRALDRQACEAGLSGAALRVWMITADYTLGYCRVADRLTHGRLAEETGLSRRSVRRALAEVAEAGLIRYRAGAGNPGSAAAFSSIEIVMPASGAREDRVGHSERTGLATQRGQGWPLREDRVGHLERTGLATNRERANRERANRERVVASASEVATARGISHTPADPSRQDQPSPAAPVGQGLVLPEKTSQDQQQAAGEILTALASACRADGHPLTRSAAVRAGIEAALATGYGRDAVLVGLGFWRAEGYCSPRQIAEMTERAATRGLPPVGASPTALLAEGAGRFSARSAGPKHVRENSTLLALANYTRRPRESRQPMAVPPIIAAYQRTSR